MYTMAYVGTYSAQNGSHLGTRPSGPLARIWSHFSQELGRQLFEDRRDLSVDRSLRDLDRRQLNDIGICRDGC